jgi:predicted transcriptional regulator of viral defense system
MAIRCPNCNYLLGGVKERSYAIRLVLSRAAKATPLKTLASAYMTYAGCDYLGACRAIQRLAKEGLLRRVRKGLYRARS